MQNEINELSMLTTNCYQELHKLKEENHQKDLQIKAITEAIHVLSDSISEIINSINGLTNTVNEQSSYINQYAYREQNIDAWVSNLQQCIANLKYEILDPNLDTSTFFYPHILDASVAIDKIINEHKSIARFGDGEFAIMMKQERQKFQHLDDHLAQRLYEVLHSNNPQLLIGIANNYGSLDKYNANGKLGIRLYMTDEVRASHKLLIDSDRVYYDAYMSRPYALFQDNYTDAPQKRFSHLKQIWQDRKVIFVEGSLTRLGVGNDLFDNAHSIQRIIAPPTSSFDKYNAILEASLKYAEPDTLFLLAIGPSAGVLAYDLCKNGYQAVDIGHVDLEYEWFLQGKGSRCAVPTKYNNEFYGGDIVEPIHDEKYMSQILCSFAETM